MESLFKHGPHRGLETRYTPEGLGSMEMKCSKMILDCVDWDADNLDSSEIAKMYDMLYQIYCGKLSEEGLEYSREKHLRDWVREGHRIRVEGERRQVSDDDTIVTYIFLGLTTLCTIVYYICLWFCLNEDQSVDEGAMRRKVRDAKQRQAQKLERVVQQSALDSQKRSIKKD